MDKICKRIINIFIFTFLVISIIIFLNTIFSNHTVHIEFRASRVWIVVGLYFALIFAVKKFLGNRKKKAILIIGCIVVGIIQLYIVTKSYTAIGWDCRAVVTNVINLIEGEGFNKHYFINYPNNIALLILFKNFLAVLYQCNIVNAWLSLDILNLIFIDLSVGITYFVAKEIFGKDKAYLSFLFTIPLIAFTPYLIVPYTDTISMLFPILSFYLFLKSRKTMGMKKYSLTFGFGMTLMIGFFIKPTCIIIGIALIIIQILYGEKDKEKNKEWLKSLMWTCVFLLLGIILAYGAFSFTKYLTFGDTISKEDYELGEFPLTHFMMMGLTKKEAENGKYLYGMYDKENVERTYSYQGKKEKMKMHLEVIKERLSDMGAKRIFKICLS